MTTELLSALGLTLIAAGISIVFAAVVMHAFSTPPEKRRRVRGGGVILIGPLPIVFGSDARTARTLLYVTLVLVCVVLVFLLLPTLVTGR